MTHPRSKNSTRPFALDRECRGTSNGYLPNEIHGHGVNILISGNTTLIAASSGPTGILLAGGGGALLCTRATVSDSRSTYEVARKTVTPCAEQVHSSRGRSADRLDAVPGGLVMTNTLSLIRTCAISLIESVLLVVCTGSRA